mgnify:CR=1 FL=1
MGYSCLNFCKTGEVRPVGKIFNRDYVLQMDKSQRFSQLLAVLMEVRRWPGLLPFSEINQVASYLGPIGAFKDIESDGYLVDALVQL